MKPYRRLPHRRVSRGFTLVESIVVIVVLAITGMAIVSIQTRIFGGQTSVKDLQVGTRLMQECAEQALATRRFGQEGYTLVTSDTNVTSRPFNATACGGVTALSGYSIPAVDVTDGYTGPGCPTNGTCKLVSITQGGLTPLTLMLVDY
jgi:prepilin-type N-terminal cleavage/methylation domain-containing protein